MIEKQVALGPFIENDFGDRYLYEVNRTAFNKVGSHALYRQVLGEKLFQKDALNIVIGTDSGLLIEYVLKKGLPDGSRFLFVELYEVIRRIEDSKLSMLRGKGVEVATYDAWKKTAEHLDLTSYVSINRVVLEQSIGAIDANIMKYQELYSRVYEELTSIIWEIRANLGTQGFVVRQLENLAENRLSSACLKDAFKRKTAFLLGGGPSLDEMIPWIKANRDRVVILAVSRICRRLLECRLTPHMVFSVDPQYISFEISKELFYFWRKTLFLHVYHVSTPLLAQWRGKSLYSGPRFPWKTHLNESTLPAVGPTVTNMALASAVEMGFSRILLAGVDLCHSKDGFTHARGSDNHDVGPQLGTMGIRVETNGGWMAETRPDYACAMRIIDDQAREALKKGCEIINTAAGAAKIQSISYSHPDEIGLQRLTETPEEIIARAVPTEGRDERTTHYHTMLEELGRAEFKLTRIRKLTLEALKSIDHLLNNTSGRTEIGPYRRMNKIENTLNKKFKDFVPLVKQFGLQNFIRVIRPGEVDGYIEETDRITRLKVYYESYRDSLDRLTEILEVAAQRLRARLEEEKSSPDMELLIEQWKADQQPGRYLVWKNRCPCASGGVAQHYTDGLKELRNAFQVTMKEVDTRHMRIIRASINFAEIKNKATRLFQRRNMTELDRLAEGLIGNTDSKAKPILTLVRGYIEELHGNMLSALEVYHGLISEETDGGVLEEALGRIAYICIENRDIENTVTALQCLAHLSPVYAPQYADALKMTGDIDAAVETYTEYLQKVPDDLATMMKLGNLYKEIHSEEPARMAFVYVLERDPDNNAAKASLESLIPISQTGTDSLAKGNGTLKRQSGKSNGHKREENSLDLMIAPFETKAPL